MLPMILGIEQRLSSSRLRARCAALRSRAEQAITRTQQKRVERSIDLLIEREPEVTAAAQADLTSIMPSGLQSTLEKQILLKKMLGQTTPKRLTRRWS